MISEVASVGLVIGETFFAGGRRSTMSLVWAVANLFLGVLSHDLKLLLPGSIDTSLVILVFLIHALQDLVDMIGSSRIRMEWFDAQAFGIVDRQRSGHNIIVRVVRRVRLTSNILLDGFWLSCTTILLDETDTVSLSLIHI